MKIGAKVNVKLNSGVWECIVLHTNITSSKSDKSVSKVVEVEFLDHPTLKRACVPASALTLQKPE